MTHEPGKREDGAPTEPTQPPRDDLDALFARNLHHVRAFVRLRIDTVVRNQEAISDIVQSACREVLANDAFEFRDEVAFRSYLCQAALHKIQNRRRHYHAKKRASAATHELKSEDPRLLHVYRTTMFDPQQGAIRAEEITQLELAFEKLPADYREVLTLYRIVGMPIVDLARQLGRTEGATKMLLNRAMTRLTSILEAMQKGTA